MQSDKFFHVVEIFKIVINFVETPIPPFDSKQRFDDVLGKSELDNFCGVAADDCIGRNVFDDDAVRGDDHAVTDDERFFGICRFQNATAPDPNVVAD